MFHKRGQALAWVTFASITSVILCGTVVRVAFADNRVQVNLFAVEAEAQAPAAVPASKLEQPRPIRITPPANDTSKPAVEAEVMPPLTAIHTLPDSWAGSAVVPDGEAGGEEQAATEDVLALPAEPPTVSEAQVLPEQGEAVKPQESEPTAAAEDAKAEQEQPNENVLDSTAWWNADIRKAILNRPRWVKFDLETVLIDTLQNSPLIKSVSYRTSVASERIIVQDAAFDPNMLFSVNGGQVNDPVGNILTTGGASRLKEPNFDVKGGFERTTRRGGNVGLSQRLGLRDSNSRFFEPIDQGNARLSLSLTQPLFARSGQVYNERLLTQARIDYKISWQDMRSAVERRIAEVISAYWDLYRLRCHVVQQRALLERGEYIEQVVIGRAGFDASRVELAKAKQRVARRVDTLIELQAELKKQQSRLATLIGSDLLNGAESQLEMIPHGTLWYPDVDWSLRDAVVQGLQNRPEVKAAANELESAALRIEVTRTELVPQINAVLETYLAALNGNSEIGQSFVDQFSEGGPGFALGFQYEMPRGRRAARAQHREAHHRYQQRSEELRETIQRTRFEIESALIDLRRAAAQKTSKQQLLITATEEETVLTRRWEAMAGDGGNVGVVLENLLDAQQRRTEAEREWVSARTDYLISLIDLQRAMGTLLITEAIMPLRNRSDCSIEFVRDQPLKKPEPGEPDSDPADAYDQFLNNLESSQTELSKSMDEQ